MIGCHNAKRVRHRRVAVVQDRDRIGSRHGRNRLERTGRQLTHSVAEQRPDRVKDLDLAARQHFFGNLENPLDQLRLFRGRDVLHHDPGRSQDAGGRCSGKGDLALARTACARPAPSGNHETVHVNHVAGAAGVVDRGEPERVGPAAGREARELTESEIPFPGLVRMHWIGGRAVEAHGALRYSVDLDLRGPSARPARHFHIHLCSRVVEFEVGSRVLLVRADIATVLAVGRARVIDVVPAAELRHGGIVAIEVRDPGAAPERTLRSLGEEGDGACGRWIHAIDDRRLVGDVREAIRVDGHRGVFGQLAGAAGAAEAPETDLPLVNDPSSLLTRHIDIDVRLGGEGVLDLGVDEPPLRGGVLEFGRVGIAVHVGSVPDHRDLPRRAGADPRKHAGARELESRDAGRVERERLRPALGEGRIRARRAADQIDVVAVGKDDMEVVALVDRHDREPVAGLESAGAVEDHPGIERVRREDRRVHRADRDVRGTMRGIPRRAPHVEIAPVAAHEGPEERPVALEHAVPSDVVGHAGGRILHERALRPRHAPVVRLDDVDVVLAQLKLGRFPEAHVDGLLSARHVPLAIESGGGEWDDGEVVPAIGRHRHRCRAEPEARHVDAARGLDPGRNAGHRRHDVEGIAESYVVVAAPHAPFGRRRDGRRILPPIRLAQVQEGRAPVVRPPEVDAARDAPDRADVDRSEAVHFDFGLDVLVDEDGAPLLLGELDLGLEAEVEVVVGRGAELVGGLRRTGSECRDCRVRLVDRPVDEH